MAVQYADGVVIGADTRTTTGSYIANRYACSNRVQRSVATNFQVSRTSLRQFQTTFTVAEVGLPRIPKQSPTLFSTTCKCTRTSILPAFVAWRDLGLYKDSTSSWLTIYRMEHGESPPVEVAANLFQQLVYGNKDALSAGIIVAGWDKYDGGSVYTVPLGGSIHKQPFSIGGSGSTYIYGYCDAKYKDNMTREECIDFTKNAIALAISRDGSSGGCIRLAVIDKQGVERIFVPGNEIPTFWEG